MKEKSSVPWNSVMQVLRVWKRTQLRMNKIQGIAPLPWKGPSIRALIVYAKQLEGDTMESVYAEFMAFILAMICSNVP